MKFKAQKRKIWFCLVLILIFLLGCNLQPFLNDVSGKNNPYFPTHFRCKAEKGLLFGADFPKAPSGMVCEVICLRKKWIFSWILPSLRITDLLEFQ